MNGSQTVKQVDSRYPLAYRGTFRKAEIVDRQNKVLVIGSMSEIRELVRSMNREWFTETFCKPEPCATGE